MENKTLTRMTRQRMAILEVLRNTDTHPTADWVYTEVREILPKISLGTVYRNLNLLRDAGEIQELSYGSNFSRFDGNPEEHPHFHCNRCHRVYDLDFELNLAPKVRAESGFRVERTRVEFDGICANCLEEED